MAEHFSVAVNSSIFKLLGESTDKKEAFGHRTLGVNHLLTALVENETELMRELIGEEVIDSIADALRYQLSMGVIGATLEVEETITSARKMAFMRGDAKSTTRDLATVVLSASSFDLYMQKTLDLSCRFSSPIKSSATKKQPSIPTLRQFGTDLTRKAREGKLLPVVGRDEEIQLMIETLCRRTKRNPLLVGAAGVGKTAIVEGFAQRIVRGEVPDILAEAIVILLQPSLIVSGSGKYGELEDRMNPILAEATQDGVFLFIDEFHSIIGAGGTQGTADIATLMKPALSRGDIACIAATTDDEYRRFVEPDTALERRFQPIRVQEMGPAQVLLLLQSLRDDLRRTRGVNVSDQVIIRIIDYAEKYMRNRTFPDKAVDLIEQCVANAITRGDIDVDLSEAESVVQRMIGIPLDLGTRIVRVRQSLIERCLMTESDIECLVTRLQVTMRGLDIQMMRPNAVLLFVGDAARHGEVIAETISKGLFESYSRVIKIDMARFAHFEDKASLLGASPSYVGYGDGTQIHCIKQHPWSVVLFENIDTAHPHVCQILVQAIRDGYFLDGQSRKIFLSDAIVILTTKEKRGELGRSIGFDPCPEISCDNNRKQSGRHINAALDEVLDLVCTHLCENCDNSGAWLRKELLSGLAEAFEKSGIHLRWDPSLLLWLESRNAARMTHSEWVRLVDREISPVILSCVNDIAGAQRFVLVKYSHERVEVEEYCQ